ncbi:MAG: IS701 family transposase, partial [Candidatus Freyarchaeota archaeon]
ALRSFVRLEAHRLRTGLSWYEAKTGITREAIRTYLANPAYILSPTA